MGRSKIGDEGRDSHHVDCESGLACDGDVEAREVGPGLGGTRDGSVLREDGSAAASRVHGPSEHGEGRDDRDDRLDEKQPAHLPGVYHHKWELYWAHQAKNPILTRYHSHVQKTKYAMSLLLVTPTDEGMLLWYVLSDGQIASSMISMHDEPMYVLMLHASARSDHCKPGETYPKYRSPRTRRDATAK